MTEAAQEVMERLAALREEYADDPAALEGAIATVLAETNSETLEDLREVLGGEE